MKLCQSIQDVKLHVRLPVQRANHEHTEPSNCPVCEEVIKEPTDKAPGDEAIFCVGQCEAWFHRKCAGISKVYKSTSESDNPFYCILCLQTYFNNEIS